MIYYGVLQGAMLSVEARMFMLGGMRVKFQGYDFGDLSLGTCRAERFGAWHEMGPLEF